MKLNMGEFPSGQRGQTVNLLSTTSVVRIHHLPPSIKGSFRNGMSFFRNFFGILGFGDFSAKVVYDWFRQGNLDTNWTWIYQVIPLGMGF